MSESKEQSQEAITQQYEADKDETQATYNIFVGDLSADVTDDDLREAFSPYGALHSVSVTKDRTTGFAKGFGFVNFLSEEARNKVLNHSKEINVKGKLCRCYPSESKNTLYIGGIPKNMTAEEVRPILVKMAGPVEAVHVKSGGFCFVQYINFRQAEKALARLKNQEIDGKRLNVQLAQSREKKEVKSKSESASPVTLYVRNVSSSVNDESFKAHFSPYGTVLKATLVRNPATQKHKGFGFIEYDTGEGAKIALDTLNGTEFEGQILTIEYSVPKAKEKPVSSSSALDPYAAYAAYYGQPVAVYDDRLGQYVLIAPPPSSSSRALPPMSSGYPPYAYGYPESYEQPGSPPRGRSSSSGYPSAYSSVPSSRDEKKGRSRYNPY